MICQVCGKKTATTHVKSVSNGKLTELHLCEDCAAQHGYTNIFSDFGFAPGSLLGGLFGFGEPQKQSRVGAGEKPLRCKKCGMSFSEIAKTGNVGCSECYNTFRTELIPIIRRIHGSSAHKGKTPVSSALKIADANTNIVAVSPLDEKRAQLKKAIEAQEFEKAAELRDEIKEMEQNG